MKVISIKADKGYTSPSNNITYHNYYLNCAINREVNGENYQVLHTFTVTDAPIRKLLEGGKIRSINDLVGHEIELYRKFPVYFDKIEREYMLKDGKMKADTLVVVK